MGWCCDFPLSNGSCAQGVEVSVQAGIVLPNATSTSTIPSSPTSSSSTTNSVAAIYTNETLSSSTDSCEANHDAAIGAGVGIPLVIAVASLLALWLRERRLRKNNVGNTSFEAIPQVQPGEMKAGAWTSPNACNWAYGGHEMNGTTPDQVSANQGSWTYEADKTSAPARQIELP
jgi:DMSO/TMAO reductase YedYZ molybdopterin-dependent catalytic subunit